MPQHPIRMPLCYAVSTDRSVAARYDFRSPTDDQARLAEGARRYARALANPHEWEKGDGG
jgi:hypothetical protein